MTRSRIRSPLMALLVAIAFGMFVTDAVAQAAPTAVISFTKANINDPSQPDIAEFKLTVTNTAPNPLAGDDALTVSGQVVLNDQLPGNTLWIIASVQGFTCDPLVSPTYLLHCTATGLHGRHLNTASTDFIYDSASVTVQGLRQQCGPITNVAILTGADFIGIKRSSATAAGYPCPTPTPTPVTPTATPTPIPATPTPTATVAVITETPATATAIPTAVSTPKPPNTGRGVKDENHISIAEYVIATTIIVASIMILVALAWSKKQFRLRH